MNSEDKKKEIIDQLNRINTFESKFIADKLIEENPDILSLFSILCDNLENDQRNITYYAIKQIYNGVDILYENKKWHILKGLISYFIDKTIESLQNKQNKIDYNMVVHSLNMLNRFNDESYNTKCKLMKETNIYDEL